MARATRKKQNTRTKSQGKKLNKNRLTATGIDIGTYSVKIATVVTDSSGQMDFKKISIVPLKFEENAPENPAELYDLQKDALKEAIKQHGFLDGTVVLGVPRGRVMIRYLELPSTSPDELDEMLAFDVERHVPYAAHELEISFQILKHKNDHESEVMMVSVPKKELHHYVELCTELDVNIDMIIPDVMGDNYAYSVNASPEESIALVNFGRTSTNLSVIRDKKLLFSRTISCSEESLLEGFARAKQWRDLQGRVTAAGVVNPKEREHFSQWVDELSMELMRSVQAYVCQYAGGKIDRMVLTGGSGYFPAGPPQGLNVKIKTKVTIEPALNGELPPSDEYNGTEVSTVAGLALCGTDKEMRHLSLLPETFTRERINRQRGIFRKNAGILVAMVLTLMGGAGYLYWYEQYQDNSTINEYHQTLRQETNAVEAMRKKIETVENYIDHQNSCVNVIRDVLAVLPDKVYIRDITFEKRKSLQINGQVQNQNVVFDIKTELLKLKPDSSDPNSENYFWQVNDKSNQKVLDLDATEMQVTEFSMTCYLNWDDPAENNNRR